MHTDTEDFEDVSTSSFRSPHPNEHGHHDMNNIPEARGMAAGKPQLQQIMEESYPDYRQLSEDAKVITAQNTQSTASNVANVFKEATELADSDRLDDVVLRPRVRRTELPDTVTLTDRTSDQTVLRFKTGNKTNLRTNSYGSSQDLRPSSMTDVSSPTKSSSRLRDVGRSSTMETRTLPSLRPLSAGRTFSASMVNLSRIGSLDVSGSETKRLSGSTLVSRATTTDYPKTRQKNGSAFQVDVLKGIAGIGIKVKVTAKGYAQITDIQRGGPVDKNGQVRVGDNILFVNTTELTGYTDARVQQVLRLLPRGLTKLVVSGATSSEYETQNGDYDNLNTGHSQQLIEKHPSPQPSSTISKEQFSFPAERNYILHKTSMPSFVPSPTAARVASRNSTRSVNSDAVETTPSRYQDESNHQPYTSRPDHDLLHGNTIHKHEISLKETDREYLNDHKQQEQEISNSGIINMNSVRTQRTFVNEEKGGQSGSTSEFDTSVNMSSLDTRSGKSGSVEEDVNMSGSQTNTVLHSVVGSKSITDLEMPSENPFKDDPDTSNQHLSRSRLLSDNIDQSTLAYDNIDRTIMSSDNIDQSTLLSHKNDKSAIFLKNNEDVTSSLNTFHQSTLSSNNKSQSTVLSNSIDGATLTLEHLEQSKSSLNSTHQPPLASNKSTYRSENITKDETGTISITSNELSLKSPTANEGKLNNVESNRWPVSKSIEQTPKLYRGVLVNLVDTVNREESPNTKPELRIQTDRESLKTATNIVEHSVTGNRKTSVSATPAESGTKTAHANTISEQPVPKKRTSLVQNVNIDKGKAINTSLIPTQERRKNRVATLPPVSSSYPGSSALLASRSMSVSTPALNPKKINSLEHSLSNIENTNYQKNYFISPTPKHTTTKLSADYISHSRISPMYASRSLSVSSPALTPKKITLLEHSPRDIDSTDHHSKAVLSPVPLNSALSPRRISSDSSHMSAFIFPTQYTHTNKDDPSGRLSGAKNRTAEHPHAYKTVQSQLYKAVHPDIYKSASVILLDKKLMSQEQESSNRGQSYDVVYQPHRKSPPYTNQTRLFSSNATDSNTGLENTIKKSHDLFVSSSFGVTEANPDATLLLSAGKDVASSLIKDLKATDNVLPYVSEIKRPVAPARKLKRPKETEMDEATGDTEETQSINTNILKTDDICIQEQKQDSKSNFAYNLTSDLLSSETPTSNDLLSNTLEEKQVKSNEEFINVSHGEISKPTNLFHQNDNGSNFENNNLDEFDGAPKLAHSITNSSDCNIYKNPSFIIHKNVTNVANYSENSQQDIQDKKGVMLQAQSFFKEIENARSTHIAQDVDGIFNVNAREDVNEGYTLEHDSIADQASRIVNDVIMKLRNNPNLLYPNDEFIDSIHLSSESAEDDPTSLPDTPPPLPNAPPPINILGDNSAQHWDEQNELYVTPENWIENKAEKQGGMASSLSQNTTIESNALQMEVSIQTRELPTTALSDVTGTSDSHLKKTISTEPQMPNAVIIQAREDMRGNSPSPIDMLSEDSGMPADEDQEMATDDTTSTPGELADNTFGLDSLKHVPCPTDIEAGLFPSMHDVSLPLESSSVLETSNFVNGSEKRLDNIIEEPDQSVETFDVFSEDISNNLPPPILPLSALSTTGVSTSLVEELLTQHSTAVQETDIQQFAPENSLLSTDFLYVEKQEVLPSKDVDATIQELSELSDNSVFTNNAQISNDTLASSLDDNNPKLPVSESPGTTTDTIISNRKWCLRSNTASSPVLTAEAGVPVQVSYTEKNLLKSLPYNNCIRLVERANGVLDAASAPPGFTLLILHLHRDADIVPLGVDLKHEGGIWFRVSGIKNGSPLWKEGGAEVGDLLLAVDSLWCDNVTVMRFLTRLANPQHDSLLVLCRHHESVDDKDSKVQDVTVPSMQNKLPADESQHYIKSSREHKMHSHFSETANVSPSKLISLEVNTAHDQQLLTDKKAPVHHKQSLPLETHVVLEPEISAIEQSLFPKFEESQSSLAQESSLVYNVMLPEHSSSLSELASSLSEQPPSLPTQEPPIQEQVLILPKQHAPIESQSSPPQKQSRVTGEGPLRDPLHTQPPPPSREDPSFQAQSSHLPIQGQSPPLPVEGPPLQGQSLPLSQGILPSRTIDHGPLISNKSTSFQDDKLSLSQQVPLMALINNQPCPRTDSLQLAQPEQTFQATKRAQESKNSTTIVQERPARSGYIQQQTQSESSVTSNEDVSVRRTSLRSMRTLNGEQAQSEVRTTQRREYLRMPSRKSLEEPLKELPHKNAHIEEQLRTIVNSAELTADAGPGIYQVVITKGATGVGFCLEGGVGSPRGDVPITIKRIFKGGTAEKNGLLKVNDEILEVNGLKFSQMRHYEAWNYLKFIDDGEVNITIHRK